MGDTPEADCCEPPSLLRGCNLGEGMALAAASRDLPQDLPHGLGTRGEGEETEALSWKASVRPKLKIARKRKKKGKPK